MCSAFQRSRSQEKGADPAVDLTSCRDRRGSSPGSRLFAQCLAALPSPHQPGTVSRRRHRRRHLFLRQEVILVAFDEINEAADAAEKTVDRQAAQEPGGGGRSPSTVSIMAAVMKIRRPILTDGKSPLAIKSYTVERPTPNSVAASAGVYSLRRPGDTAPTSEPALRSFPLLEPRKATRSDNIPVKEAPFPSQRSTSAAQPNSSSICSPARRCCSVTVSV